MPEYNFIPDYAAWWKKRDLSKEQLCWLVLGVSPNDIVKKEKIHVGANASPEDIKWLGEFRAYTDGLANGWWIYDNYKDFISNIGFGRGKEDFINNCYDYAIKLPIELINAIEEWKPNTYPTRFDKYRNHKIFLRNLDEVKLPDIKTEEDAFSVFLELAPEYFRQMCEIESFRDGGGDWKDMTPENRHFSIEYHAFLKKHLPQFDVVPHKIIYSAWTKARKLECWKNQLIEYAQSLFDEGFVFSESVFSFLESNGFKRQYSDGAWAVRFYERWNRETLWSLEEALLLYKGASPLNNQRCFVDLAQIQAVFTCGSDPLLYEEFDERFIHIVPRVEKHVSAGMLDEIIIRNQRYYYPPYIVSWMLRNIPYSPPDALLKVLQVEEKSHASIGKEEIRKINKRRSDIHYCIGWAWNEIKQSKEGKPSAKEVWKKLKDNQCNFSEIIQEFGVSPSTKEEAIFWKSENDVEQELSYSTFQNIVSAFNQKRKVFSDINNNE